MARFECYHRPSTFVWRSVRRPRRRLFMKEVTMSPRKKTLVILGSAFAAVLAIGAAVAVPAHMYRHGGGFGEFGFGHGIGRALASLDLTDEQKSQVKAILK